MTQQSSDHSLNASLYVPVCVHTLQVVVAVVPLWWIYWYLYLRVLLLLLLRSFRHVRTHAGERACWGARTPRPS